LDNQKLGEFMSPAYIALLWLIFALALLATAGCVAYASLATFRTLRNTATSIQKLVAIGCLFSVVATTITSLSFAAELGYGSCEDIVSPYVSPRYKAIVVAWFAAIVLPSIVLRRREHISLHKRAYALLVCIAFTAPVLWVSNQVRDHLFPRDDCGPILVQ
jgi:hypothetical protein